MPHVARLALGDVEIDDAGTMLFAVNLYDRLIYRFAVPDGEVLGVFPNGAAGEEWVDDARPFGLGFRDGWLYHGVIDSRESTGGRAGPGSAHVYRSRPDGSEMTEVVRLDLS